MMPAPSYKFEGLPDLPAMRELQELPQWVAWRYALVNGRWTKPPVNVHTGFGASSSDPKTWAGYDQAEAMVLRKSLAGVGFVISKDDPYTGADLDHVIEGGKLVEWAQEIVDQAETYTEISPSGEGLRIIWRGKIETSVAAKTVGVEMYRAGRFLTLTGNHWPGTPTSIREAPRTKALLDARVDIYKAERAKASGGVATGSNAVVLARGSGGEFFRNVNTYALANLHTWVPSLFGTAAKFQPGTGAFRLSSRDLGRENEEDLSIAPNGIVDWGIHDMGDSRDGKRTAVDVVLEFGNVVTAKDAAMWLCERVGRDPAQLGWDDGPRLSVDEENAIALLARREVMDDGAVIDADTGEILEDAPVAQSQRPDEPNWTIGGLGSAIADVAFETARRPSPQFAFMSAMGILAAIFGRRYLTPTGGPLNLYMLGVAKSGFGKDHSLDVVRTFLHENKLADKLLGPSDISSDSAIEKLLRRQPCCVMPLDEVGIFFQGLTSRNIGGHERRIRKVMLELYSLGRGVWSGKETADKLKDTGPIWCPTLTMMGFSTPTELYEGIQQRNLNDGFLARMILVELFERPQQNNHATNFKTTPELAAITKRYLDKGNVPSMAENRPQQSNVPWGKGGLEAFEPLVEWQDKVMDADEDVAGRVNRFAENVLRLATLRALSWDPDEPNVEAGDIEWAEAIMRASLYSLDEGLRIYLADSDFERGHKTAYETILRAGDDGMPESHLRRSRGISKLDYNAYKGIIDFLLTSHLVVMKDPKEEGRMGRPGKRYWAVIGTV